MNVLLVSSLLFASTVFAQTLDLRGLKTLLTQRQAVLEQVYPGMSKSLVTKSKIPTELGPCELTETAIQTILKIEGEKIIIHSKESYVPAQSPACAGFESQNIGVIFYEDKPSLAKDLAALDEIASQIRTISKNGETVLLALVVPVTREDGSSAVENVAVKYDLTKSSFKNTVLVQDSNTIIQGQDIADIDIHSIDLKKVLFCESADSDQCAEGDWSDILF